jgi:hypothetical protein
MNIFSIPTNAKRIPQGVSFAAARISGVFRFLLRARLLSAAAP